VTEKVGGFGVVGVLNSGKQAKGGVVLYRADLDALPITESTGLTYASKRAGVMHACGHDLHMAIAVATLKLLRSRDQHWAGTVVFVGQPAEEVGRGARAMLADSAFRKILARTGTPRLALALHDTSDFAAGDFSLVPGWHTANVDSVDIVVHGKGGHDSRPHESVDPIVIASELVLSLQTIVARRVAPGERAVVTVGSFTAGTKHNIIPPTATLLITVRSYGDTMRAFLLAEIARVAKSIAAAHNAPKPPDVIVRDEFTPAGYNDPAWTEKLRELFARHFGAEHVHGGEPWTGGEDFGLLARELAVPGVLVRLGAADPSKLAAKIEVPGTHSDKFAPAARPALEAGARAMALAIEAALAGP
ncbi:MAG: amidohydrolase, partial [Deltaproteobacteria bacterium]|nr:amidohydrolase [Deltaproteobacteria bacterium]